MNDQPNSKDNNQTYRVLARKYRPSNFDELIGQESLVQTLSNALAMGRLAHAFVLTGLRGIGKTTTARIIARGLNCIGTDGNGGATLTPCGVCSSCVDILDGRHVDVIEMDAASNTGVDDVREIIDGVGYRPLSARFKIYIIDEVHMLSKNAFNALLKTLEEPPEAVKFIFATTEIRKVPVTVLSRCQRFDLRRVPNAMMAAHLKNISAQENITIDAPALERLSRAAEGSVRDALSLLDQAAALTADNVSDDAVAGMLGQAGRSQALALTSIAMSGDAAGAMGKLGEAVQHGAEPLMVINDMLGLLHLASRVAAGGHLNDVPESEAEQLKALADMAGIARLGRAWQIVLKGHGELNVAPNPHAAADMLIIRLAHAAVMPTPADLIRKLEKAPVPPTPVPQMPASKTPMPQTPVPPTPVPQTAEPEPPKQLEETPPPSIDNNWPNNLRMLAGLCEDKGERILASTLRMKINNAVFAENPERAITLSSGQPLDNAIAVKLMGLLREWTGQYCAVELSNGGIGQTIEEEDEDSRQQNIANISTHPLVAASLQAFPGASISVVEDADLSPERQRHA